ncbi:hypothetical protein [Actinoallomurus rhizosphaericola]|uniref:hypothetical protein n=1 Tax=Actinoallomurus rhizosphaericola TaxID=2952536 RepID=UPI002093B44C|nr:hypothetical protein [Actinoallomurus rhizosphaericola]MCO5998051.1 hypothetical protein [Actinoallomurus rhizosphaericola]
MTPTLRGRLQTRLFLAATVGVLWTAIISPFLPEPPGVTTGMSYSMAFDSLLLMAVYGLVWEHLYHRLQQRRWDRDWPSVFALLTVLNEALLVWLLDHLFPVMSGPMPGMSGSSLANAGSLGLDSPYLAGFVVHMGTTWGLMWLFGQGPMRVIFVRWRFEGGLIVHSHVPDSAVPGDRPAISRPEGAGTSEAGVRDAVPGTAAARLTLRPHTGLARVNGNPTSASSGDLVEGNMCDHGHFGHPGMRYCMICGGPLPQLNGTRVLGRRPPLGVLILDDGVTHVLDGDVRLAEADGPGPLTAGHRDEIPAASALADIRLAGWQPFVSSELHPIALALPGGGDLHIAPGASARLMPGTEFTVAARRIRYESPYQPVEPASATADPYAGAVSEADAATSPAAATPSRPAPQVRHTLRG